MEKFLKALIKTEKNKKFQKKIDSFKKFLSKEKKMFTLPYVKKVKEEMKSKGKLKKNGFLHKKRKS